MPKKIEISHRTIVFTVFFLISLWILYQIRFILLSLFIAFVLMTALNQLVEKLTGLKIPRSFAVIIIYVVLLSLLSLAVGGLVPILVDQTGVLLNQFPDYLRILGLKDIDASNFQQQLGQIGLGPSNVLKIGLSIFNNFLSVVTILILTFYLLVERKDLHRHLSSVISNRESEKTETLLNQLETSLGGWVRAEIVLMTVIGFLTYIGLSVLGIDYALSLAILAGLLEIVPNLGPTIAAVPAVVIGLAISPLTGLAVVALYFLIQQLENTLIVPKIMQKAVGFNPIVTLIVIMIGLKLGGPLGALLSVPFTLLIKILISEFLPETKIR